MATPTVVRRSRRRSTRVRGRRRSARRTTTFARASTATRTTIDPYAADSPAEFFAVLSEVFFAAPSTLRDDYPDVYRQFATFYRQDPASRAR